MLSVDIPWKYNKTADFLILQGCIERKYWLKMHCVKSVRIRSYSGKCFPTFKLNLRTSLYSAQMREYADQNNSEYGHFLCISE